MATAIGCLVGGSSASNLNAGWFDSDAVAVADTFAANGASVDGDNGGAVTSGAGAKVLITDAGQFSNTSVGMFIRVNFAAGYVDGRFEITAKPDGDNAVLIAEDYATDEDVTDWNVGGAVPILDATFELQDVLDDPTFGTAASRNVDIYVTGLANITTTIDIDAGGGTTTTRKRLLATNTSYIYTKGGCTLTATANLINGVFRLGSGSGISYIDIIGFVIDGGGAGDAERGIRFSDGSSIYNSIIDCTIQNVKESPGYGVQYAGNSNNIINTTIDGCIRGVHTDTNDGGQSKYINSTFSNNTTVGVFIDGTNTQFIGCKFIGNGAGLIFDDSENWAMVQHCTFLNNVGDGVEVDALALGIVIMHCVSSGNGGFGYNITNNNINTIRTFGYNHSHNETDCSDTGTWATLGLGNNITGDPKFVDATPGSEDLNYQNDSPCIGAGINGVTLGAGVHPLDYPVVGDVGDGVFYSNNELEGTLVGGGGDGEGWW